MIFDPLYMMMILPAVVLSLLAQVWVRATYKKYVRIPTRRGLSGRDVALEILQAQGITDVEVEMSRGFLSDHYAPTQKKLRLSPQVYQGNSIVSAGIAAHEVGHAIQHQQAYKPLVLRNAIVPVASLGSRLAWLLLIIGFVMQSMGMIKLGVIFFSTVVLFQVLTLPVEFNASLRAQRVLAERHILGEDELAGTRRVLTAAAMTYVAAAAMAVLQLLYFLLRAGLLGGGDD